MPGSVAVVTDSTAYLPPALVSAGGVTVVPLQVVVGGTAHEEAYGEGEPGASPVPGGAPRVAEALRHWVPVSTSRPAPSALRAAYDAAARAGADAVVSIHLSAAMSGTVESAQLAAEGARLPVRVVDSGTLGMGLGFAVLSAAAAAREGAGVEEVAAVAAARAAKTATYFYVDTLEHLRRGGRIGAAQAFLGSALAVKPILHVAHGRIEPLDKVRTSSRALARLEELAVERAGAGAGAAVGGGAGAGAGGAPAAGGGAGGGAVDVAVHHLAAADRAQRLADRLRTRLPTLGELHLGEVGAVVGAHTGPGMLGVVIAPR